MTTDGVGKDKNM